MSVCLQQMYALMIMFFFLLLQNLAIFLANQSCLSKHYFKLWADEESNTENYSGHL